MVTLAESDAVAFHNPQLRSCVNIRRLQECATGQNLSARDARGNVVRTAYTLTTSSAEANLKTCPTATA